SVELDDVDVDQRDVRAELPHAVARREAELLQILRKSAAGQHACVRIAFAVGDHPEFVEQRPEDRFLVGKMMIDIPRRGTRFVGLVWAFFGYSIAFGHASRWCGGSEYFFLRGVGLDANGTIPHVLFFAYQGTFAIITAALISGAIVERMRFGPYVAFISLWSLIVYAPIAHWVWGGGWLARLGVLDFAGGTVVHVNAGVASLVAAISLGPR